MEDLERIDWWHGKRVLVTGSTGVIGINLINRLEDHGADVVALVRDWVPRTRTIGTWLDGDSGVTLVRGELEDRDLIMRTLAEYETEYVFHLGAQTIVGVGNRSPITTFKANIEGTWNLLESIRVLNDYSPDIKAVCVASSDKAYGSSPTLPYHEKMPLHGEHPYDVSKSCADLIAQSYGRTYKLPISIARMGNIYGPGDLNFNRIVPGSIKSIIEGNNPEIRSDGTPIREYFYVEDAVDAYLTMAEQTVNLNLAGDAFNFSSGEKMTAREVVEMIISVMESDARPLIQNTSRHEIQDQYLSIEKAKKMLNWHPRHSFIEGLTPTIAWYRKVLA
ncbi:NAD-dependent epimerase/dehydratase family protein [Methanocalculus taiwanensis]|uniref:NAD-dependent epimerase/dehydratase family protein n=1 Tax=Methanocalculus taiwanensis TaxID=106207 RepID=A0ABD4TKW8_9EURY|nr:GDP-mannose 4,6-dehydratase [Methanocalculus taiwanensis]MCQ1538465.1 NAD-dependent epimerase/dehydratase family protein [Methanocalculus taiwanensis]